MLCIGGGGSANAPGLVKVIFGERARGIEIWDPNSPAPNSSPPGQVTLQIQTEPARFLSIQSAVDETRAAGVQAVLVRKKLYFPPPLLLTISPRSHSVGQGELICQGSNPPHNYQRRRRVA